MTILLDIYGGLYLAFSKRMYDTLFDAAHLLDFIGNLAPLLGISIQELYEIRRSEREIAERRKAEDALREAHDMLEQKVEERTRDLRLAQSQLVLQEKMASVGRLAAGIAHELNNPVSFVATNFGTLQDDIEGFKQVVSAYRELLTRLESEGMGGGQIADIRKKEEAIALDSVLGHIDKLFAESKDGFRRIAEIINSIRDFSRSYDTGRFTRCSVNKSVQDALTIGRTTYKYHAAVETTLGDVPDIMGVPDEIDRVFLNLIVNAAQAITEQHRDELGHIFVRTYADKTSVFCEIGDDGPGIPDAVKDRIFDPFFTTKEPGKGMGLGLSISWDIVNSKHGGSLSVEDREGGGALFVVRLPLNQTGKDAKR